MNTTPGISDSDANIASDALVLPVDAQATRVAPTICAWVNAAAMPLSLNDPDGFRPSYCRNNLPGVRPTFGASSRASCRLVRPSPIVTICLTSR